MEKDIIAAALRAAMQSVMFIAGQAMHSGKLTQSEVDAILAEGQATWGDAWKRWNQAAPPPA